MKIINHVAHRKTEVTLTAYEFEEAIRDYLIKKEIRDTSEHIKLNPIKTNDDRGIILEIEINNYKVESNDLR